jgi:hypothetical protein
MRALAVVMAFSGFAAAGPAAVVDGAEPEPVAPVWRLDVLARGVGSIATGTRSDAGSDRTGLAPAVAVRLEHRAGSLELGGSLAASIPAWAGQLDAALSLDYERALAPGWSLAVGGDGGVSVYYFDAGLGDAVPMDALRYWGPFARVRLQLHALSTRPNGRAIGLVFGPTLGVTWAHALVGDATYGARLEPGFELGLTTRL